MAFSKKNSKRLAAAIVFLVFIGIILLIYFYQPQKFNMELSTSVEGIKHTQVDSNVIILKDFTRVETKNGKVVLQLDATIGRLVSATEIYLDGPLLTMFNEQGKTKLSASNATISLKEGKVQTAFLEGNVVANLNDETFIRTESATYSLPLQEIKAPGMVTINSTGIETQGVGLIIDTDTQSAVLLKDVKSVFWGKR